MKTLLESVNELIEKNIGDVSRLMYIKEFIENNKQLYNSDREYLNSLISHHLLKNGNLMSMQHGFCSNCGKQLMVDMNYCTTCGHHVGMSESAEQKKGKLLKELNKDVLENQHIVNRNGNKIIRNPSKHNSQNLWGIVGLAVFLAAVSGSWISVKIFTLSLSLTLADIYNTFVSTLLLARDMANSTDSLQQTFPMVGQGSDLEASEYVKPLLGLIYTIVFYPIVAIIGIIHAITKKSKLLLITGIMSISVSLSWIISILILKSAMTNSGGDSLSGMIGSAIGNSIDFGLGAIVALVGGIIMILAFQNGRR